MHLKIGHFTSDELYLTMAKWTRHLLQSYFHDLPTAFEDYGPYAACIGVETTDSAGQGAPKTSLVGECDLGREANI